LPEISVRLKKEQNKPSQQKQYFFKKRRKKSGYSNKVISWPCTGSIIQHKVNHLDLKTDPKIPSKSFYWRILAARINCPPSASLPPPPVTLSL